jgi:hypothetical protein
MEARPPAENRHGGAPRGERPASWDAPRLTSADQSRLARATTEQVRLSALRPPLGGAGCEEETQTRAQTCAAGTKNTALFDIVELRKVREAGIALVSRSSEHQRAKSRDLGATRQNLWTVETSSRVALGSRLSFRSR